MILQRPILRDQIKEYLQKQILNGRIKHEDKLSLAGISKVLSVSVTPIREALGQLQQSGIVEVIPNRGFFIPKLDLNTAKEIYPIIGHLESMAIINSENIAELAEKLAKIDQQVSESTTSFRVKYDNQFHETLISSCKNSILKSMISDLKLRVIFYETAYMSAPEFNDKSKVVHAHIVEMVRQNNKEEVAKLLETHWKDSLEFVKAYFENAWEV